MNFCVLVARAMKNLAVFGSENEAKSPNIYLSVLFIAILYPVLLSVILFQCKSTLFFPIWSLNLMFKHIVFSIQKTKQPKRNFIEMSIFYISQCKIAVRYIFYLVKRLSFPSHFNGIFIVNNKITFRTECNNMII